jgi:L-threonylcarbamoyladenylate synthase
MNTEILSAQEPDALLHALEILKEGGLVAFPTDTVYGMGAQVFNEIAVESIYQVKERPAEKAIPVLIGDIEDLAIICSEVPEIALNLAAHFWPGPLTLVLPKNPKLPKAVTATNSVGVRIPDHPFARTLLRKAGPLAVTSANRSNQPSSSTAREVFVQLNGRIPVILDGGQTPGGIASTVVDCSGEELHVLRTGPIALKEIVRVSQRK